MCAIGDVMKSSIPSVLLIESETIISINNNSEIDQTVLTDDEFLIYEALLSASELTINEISEILNKKNILKFIKALVLRICFVDEKLYSKYKPKLKRYVELNKTYSIEVNIFNTKEDLKRSPKQLELFSQFLKLNLSKFISVEDLKKRINCSSNLVKQLIDKNIFIKTFY